MNNRENKGIRLSLFGIFINIILFATKLFAGIITNSSAIIAEAFNNLLDSLSFILSIIGFKFAKKKNNHYYPFGYGRAEYLAGLIVSLITVSVGIELIKYTVLNFNNNNIIFNNTALIVLIFSIISKLIIGIKSKITSNKINSMTLRALSEDSFSDMLISTATLISYIVSNFVDVNLNGYMGIIISALIIFTGFKTMIDISKPLIGNRENLDLTKDLSSIIMSEPEISSVHDIMIHSYGNNKYYCSASAYLNGDLTIYESSKILKSIKNKIDISYSHLDIDIEFRPN